MADHYRERRLLTTTLAFTAAAVLVAGCKPGASASRTTPTPDSPATVLAAGSCHRGGTDTEPTPDPRCTPGATNPAVTPETIGQTICKSGWTKTIRPPASYTDRLKREQIAAYGYPDTNPADYEEDHLISLELGGAPSDPKNLWPEPGASPNSKDRVENAAHQAVCNHKMPLAEVQQRIATDWVGLGHQLGAL